MQYDSDPDPSKWNTSHAIVADLVGTGKRVLDVGCSTGYLARILTSRGNFVSGIELDVAAAEVAEPDLERIVVGDIETIDLLEGFDPESFDVIVFADVLEHLREPAAALCRARQLLANGGYFVLSIPNVAHGSVRLSLLEGRFEYRPLGLLDETHLRFFTRSSVEELLRSAGLFIVDMRRTTSDFFATEIPLSPADFAPDLVRDIRSDPESNTYQFVIRAIPFSSVEAPELGRYLAAANDELAALRSQVREVLEIRAGDIIIHTVGLLVEESSTSPLAPWLSLRSSVATTEIRRRLVGTALRHLRILAESPRSTWIGEPVEWLGPWDDASAEQVVRNYDALVVLHLDSEAIHDRVLSDLADRGFPAFTAGGCVEDDAGLFRGGSVRALPDALLNHGMVSVPDPLVLGSRVARRDTLAMRLHYLRAIGRLTTTRPYVLVLASGEDPGRQAGLARVVREIAFESEADLVGISPGDSVLPLETFSPFSSVIPPGEVGEIDLLALVSEAKLVVTDVGAIAALALSFERPLLAVQGDSDLLELGVWSRDPDLVAATPAELLGRMDVAISRSRDASFLRRLESACDLAYDDLGVQLTGAAGRRMLTTVPEAMRTQQSRITTLEQANLALQARLVGERLAVAQSLATGTGIARVAQLEDDLQLARRRTEDAERSGAGAVAELEAIKSTKTMRYLEPSRRIYARLRNLPRD
jgi:2-polyprenyl-3-methyl-5-hydroxy-6-metoxy-1,4-benzoquinol methylase